MAEMKRWTYLAITRALPGQEAEFDRWYDEEHLSDVAKMPGVVSARRFAVQWQKGTEWDVPQWRSLAIYEIESEDPEASVAAIRAAGGTDIMPLSEAMTKIGMVQILASPIMPKA